MLPLWESLSYKQRTHSSPSSNNCKRTSQKDLIWEKIIFNSAFILSISALLTQFTNIHNFYEMLNYSRNSKWLAILTSYLRFMLYHFIQGMPFMWKYFSVLSKLTLPLIWKMRMDSIFSYSCPLHFFLMVYNTLFKIVPEI